MRISLIRYAATLLLTTVLLAISLAATGPGDDATQPPTPTTATVAGTPAPSLPGFWELRTEDVQRELDLTADQREQIDAMGREVFDEMLALWATKHHPGGDTPPLPEGHQKRMKDLRQRIQEILSADQLDRLNLIGLRTRGVSALADPKVVDQLGITEVQQKRLRQLREQMQDGVRRIQQETLEKTLDELTPVQRRGLEQLWTGPPAPPNPVEPVAP